MSTNSVSSTSGSSTPNNNSFRDGLSSGVVLPQSLSSQSSSEFPLPLSISRTLSDKLYEKRKLGALEVEQLIKELNAQKDEERIKSVINHLVTNFSDSTQGNYRKGGLIALASTAIGLGSDTKKYIQQLVPPVLKCFTDQDPRVRYFACESLYNIAKVARGHILLYFNEIFDALCKLAADPDVNVKGGAQLLDRLIKDIVTENEKFDVDRFIPLLQERVYVVNPNCRQFLIAWVVVLDSVPDIELLQYLPKFFDGLFNMLKDASKDIRLEAEACLAEFLREIKEMVNSPPDATQANRKKKPADVGSLVKILLVHSTSKDEFTRLTAIQWINEFINIGKEQILSFSAQLLSAILPCLSHDVQDIKEAATRANTSLLRLITATSAEFGISEFLNTVTFQFLNQNVPTRLAALQWVLVLHSKRPAQLISHVEELFPALLKTLSDPAEEVIRLDLEVMAKISLLNEAYFNKLMDNLVHLFSTDRVLLENRGSLIICQLGILINPEKIYVSLARILEVEADYEFATVMIQSLNLILLTSTELSEVRASLKSIGGGSNSTSRELFTTLYRSWSHNPAATFSLCLLAQLYEHASALIFKFAELEITVNFLLEMDKLVHLLESPIFLYLRLHLLEPERYPFLFKSLYGLLMLLPQSAAFETLRNRLNSVSSLGVLQLIPKKPDAISESSLGIDFPQLLLHFHKVQQKHAQNRRSSNK